MSRRAKPEEAIEADRIEGQPHPRETYHLRGQDVALARAAQALRGGRPPQAWLIAGPPGIGKATLAYRIARYLLRYGANAEGPADLAVPANDPVSKLIEARSHPGLLVLTRRYDDKDKLHTVLGVDEIRRAGSFFGLTAAQGGWRVAIVDTADDMNDQAANALLKTLEEPPPRGILLVLAHAMGRLLPTIRSRCQRLDLRPLDEAAMRAELAERLPDADESARAALIHLGEGSLGLALRLAAGDGLEMARAVEALIESRGAPDIAAILALAERVTRARQDGLEHFGQLLRQGLAARIRRRAESGAGVGLDRWVELWEKLNAMFARADALHLEPRQTVLSAALALDARKRQSGEAL